MEDNLCGPTGVFHATSLGVHKAAYLGLHTLGQARGMSTARFVTDKTGGGLAKTSCHQQFMRLFQTKMTETHGKALAWFAKLNRACDEAGSSVPCYLSHETRLTPI